MNKIIFVFLVLISFFQVSKAQITKVFPDSTGAWRIVDNGRYFIKDHDTIIDSKIYEVLYSGTPDIYDSTTLVQTIGCYRIDSLKIYYRDFENIFYDTSEFLLYDFGLQIQDTFVFPYYNSACQDTVGMILTDIDSVFMNGEWLKRWRFDQYICNSAAFGAEWYYGIGSGIGFFSDEMLLSQEVQLSCFHNLGTDYVFNLNGLSSCYELGYYENQLNNTINIFPNPSNGKFIIEMANYQNSNYEILDLNGKLILSSKIISETTEIILTGKTGVFILRIINENGVSIEKIILTN